MAFLAEHLLHEPLVQTGGWEEPGSGAGAGPGSSVCSSAQSEAKWASTACCLSASARSVSSARPALLSRQRCPWRPGSLSEAARPHVHTQCLALRTGVNFLEHAQGSHGWWRLASGRTVNLYLCCLHGCAELQKKEPPSCVTLHMKRSPESRESLRATVLK